MCGNLLSGPTSVSDIFQRQIFSCGLCDTNTLSLYKSIEYGWLTVKLLISARAAINFRRALDPAAIGGRCLLEVYN